jgi:predicted DNA-binding transcriptional regulator AlpA
MVVEWGSQGLSLAEMAIKLGVGRSTLYRWIDEHPKFRDAVSLAQDGMSAWFAKTFRDAGIGEIPNANSGCLIFAAKNQCPNDFRDRREHTVEVKDHVEINFLGFDGEDIIEGEFEEVD